MENKMQTVQINTQDITVKELSHSKILIPVTTDQREQQENALTTTNNTSSRVQIISKFVRPKFGRTK